MKRDAWKRAIGIAVTAFIALSLLVGAQDQGFDTIYEGPVQPDVESPPVKIDVTLYGNAGMNSTGTLWATAGGKARMDLDAFAVYADGSGGTDGLRMLIGAEAHMLGFRLAGDITLAPGKRTVIDLRGWGSLQTIRITANARLAGTAPSISLGASTDFGGYGVSGNIGLAGGTISTAGLGLNTEMGALYLSISGGWTGGRVNASGGIALRLGSVDLSANTGYDSGLGINATATANLGLDPLQVTIVTLYDNTGIGLETSGKLQLGTSELSFMGRFTLGSISAELGGKMSLGAIITSLSVALDNKSGFSWAELGLELPL